MSTTQLPNSEMEGFTARLVDIADRAVAMTGAQGAAIALAQGSSLITSASCGECAPDIGLPVSPTSFAGRCFAEAVPLVCEDTENDERVNPEGCRILGIRSMIAVPVRHRERILGVLAVFAGQPGHFSDGRLRLVRTLATIVGDLVQRMPSGMALGSTPGEKAAAVPGDGAEDSRIVLHSLSSMESSGSEATESPVEAPPAIAQPLEAVSAAFSKRSPAPTQPEPAARVEQIVSPMPRPVDVMVPVAAPEPFQRPADAALPIPVEFVKTAVKRPEQKAESAPAVAKPAPVQESKPVAPPSAKPTAVVGSSNALKRVSLPPLRKGLGAKGAELVLPAEEPATKAVELQPVAAPVSPVAEPPQLKQAAPGKRPVSPLKPAAAVAASSPGTDTKKETRETKAEPRVEAQKPAPAHAEVLAAQTDSANVIVPRAPLSEYGAPAPRSWKAIASFAATLLLAGIFTGLWLLYARTKPAGKLAEAPVSTPVTPAPAVASSTIPAAATPAAPAPAISTPRTVAKEAASKLAAAAVNVPANLPAKEAEKPAAKSQPAVVPVAATTRPSATASRREEAEIAPPPPAPTPAAAPALMANVQPYVPSAPVAAATLPAQLIKKVPPTYPQIAAVARAGGKVELNATVNQDGKIGKITVLSGNPLLREAAISAVKQWVYKPATRNGEPIESTVAVEINFAGR